MQDSRRSGVLPIATKEVWDGSRVITIFWDWWTIKKILSCQRPPGTGGTSLNKRTCQRRAELCLDPGNKMGWFRKSVWFPPPEFQCIWQQQLAFPEGSFKAKLLCFVSVLLWMQKRNWILEKLIPWYWKMPADFHFGYHTWNCIKKWI